VAPGKVRVGQAHHLASLHLDAGLLQDQAGSGEGRGAWASAESKEGSHARDNAREPFSGLLCLMPMAEQPRSELELPFSGGVMPTIQTRNPVSSANRADHPLRGQSPGTERRAPSSRFRGVVPTPSYNTTDIRSFFDQCASTGSPEQHGDPQRLLEYRLALVRSLARPRPSDVVLDLGCGNGHHLLALAPDVARGIGIDVSPSMIELARARVRSSPWIANLTFEVDDAEELNGIADRSIDLAICIGAFEHMLDKRAVLASIYRVLKFGGRFFA
jgi:Methyltransferase domain